MRRVWPFVVLAVLVLVTLHPLLTYGADTDDPIADEPTSISRYDVVHDVDREGNDRVTETIAVEFPEGEERRGIFRFFDEVDPHDELARRTPELGKVTRDGRDEPYVWETRQGGRIHVLRLGDEDVVLEPGTHTYVIQYEMEGVLAPGDEDPETAKFHWDVVPGGWQQPIAEARATVRLPDVPSEVVCGTGRAEVGCTVQGEGSSTLVVSASDLPPRTRLTVLAGLAGFGPSAHDAAWSPMVAQVLGTQWWYVALVAAGVLYAGWLGGRLARRTVENEPEAFRQYTPPSGLGPHQAIFVARENVPDEAFVAALVHAAERGAVTLTRDGKDWRVEPADLSVELDEVTAWIVDELGVSKGQTFMVRHQDVETGSRITAVRDGATARTREWALKAGHLEKSGPGALGAVAVVAAFVAFGVLVWLGTPSTSLALVPGAFAALGLPMLYTGASTVRTESGRMLWAQSLGFERALSGSAGQQGFDFAGRPEHFTRYVPWAMAFGCADAWASTYRAETGHESPTPTHLGAVGVFGGAGSAVLAADFDAAVGGALSAYSSSQSSSSSTGGASGGGGGGGGGSW